MKKYRICVFCGSRSGTESGFTRAAEAVGQTIGKWGMDLVYGGGRVGLMGVVAENVMAAGGEVLGVIPEEIKSREVAHMGLTELITVSTMHERKALMAEHADAFLILPGGFGTLDEMNEIITWAQLGYHRKPIGILNVDGFYDFFISFVDHAIEKGFIDRSHRELFVVMNESEQIVLELQKRILCS